jgi:hypothetical protein
MSRPEKNRGPACEKSFYILHSCKPVYMPKSSQAGLLLRSLIQAKKPNL